MSSATTTCTVCGSSIASNMMSADVCPACLLLDAVKVSTGLGSLGGIELVEVIARGGMGIVYRARQHEPECEVALKALPGAELMSEEARQRFRIEAQAMARLEHPHILPVYEIGEEDGTPFYTMKLATGGSLAQRVSGYAGEWREIAELIATLAEAVQFAHSRGVLHRDLKPGNILFDDDGSMYVSDFGLAKLVGTDTDLTRTLAMMGTPAYLAPELVNGGKHGVSAASDVWSLGVMLYELLAGQPPFRAENAAALLRQIAEQEPEALNGTTVGQAPRLPQPTPAAGAAALQSARIPRDLAVITFKALAKDPARRYVTAQAFTDDLRRWLRGEPIHARPVPLAERAWLWAKRKPALAAVLALLVLTLAVSAGLLMRANRQLKGAVTIAQEQEARAEDALRDSLTGQAGLMRQSTQVGQRSRALALIRQAVAAGGPSLELRHEAAAALAVPDLELVGEIARFQPTGRDGRGVTVTPDLRLMLSLGADDGEVALCELGSGKVVWQPATKRSPVPDDFRLSASGQYAGLVFPDHSVEVWDTTTNQLRLTAQLVPKEREAMYRHKCRPFHLHASLPLCAGVDPEGTVWVQDLATSQRTDVITGAEKKATGVFLTETGDHLAIATGPSIEFWQIDSKRRLWRITIGNFGELLDAAGTEFLTNDRNNRDAMVIANGVSVARYLSPQISVVAGTLVPRTKLAVTLEQQGRVSAWDARDGYPWWRLRAGTGVLVAAESGRSLVMEGEPGRLMQWRRASERVFREFYLSGNNRMAATGEEIEISPDDRLVATHSFSAAMLWDAREGCYITSCRPKNAQQPGTSSTFTSSAFSPDESVWYVSRNALGILQHSLDWAENRSPLLSVPALVPGSEGKWLDHISPDGQTWVLRNQGAPYQLWRPDGTAPDYQIKDQLRQGQRLSPTLRFAYAEQNSAGRHTILDARTGQPCGEYTAVEPGRASFSPGEQWLLLREATAYRFIETSTWQQRAAVPSDVPKGQTPDAAISDDGTLVAVEQDRDVIEIRSLPSGRLLVKLTPPQDIGTAGMRFSHDGTRLYVVGLRHRLFEWNLAALQEELGKLGLAW